MIFQATVDIGGATSNFGVTTSDFRVSKAMIWQLWNFLKHTIIIRSEQIITWIHLLFVIFEQKANNK